MSDLRVCSIEAAALERAKQDKARPIYSLLRQYGLEETPKDLRSLPIALQQIYRWLLVERLNLKWSRYYLFVGMSPLFIATFAYQNYPFLWILFPFSLPIAVLALALLFATQTGWMKTRLSLFNSPFVALVGDTLIENLPDRRALFFEKEKIGRQLALAHQKLSEIDQVERKLVEKSRSLGEQSQDLVASLHEERQEMQRYVQLAQQLLNDIQNRMNQLESIRIKVQQRAELEVIRHQARQLSQEESKQFSQRAMADLEVDTIDLRHRITQFREQMENQELRFKVENELSRHM